MRKPGLVLIVCMLLVACGSNEPPQATAEENSGMNTMNEVAEQYVKLVLALGQHDGDYVDAYYGPEEWRTAAKESGKTLDVIDGEVAALQDKVGGVDPSALDEMGKLRHTYQQKQLASMRARIAFLRGEKMTFDEEAASLYDAKPPHYDDAHFQKLVSQLEELLPGEGSLVDRLSEYKKDFIIPPEKLDAVFKAAIDEGRKRTAANIELPEGENFVVEYVTDKSWSGYNWFKGKAYSLIQVNTDLPIYIERAIDLACHEGYPGHHVYNALLEKHLVNERGWVEFSVYPLFSPQSLIAEGSANYGIQVAFSHEERLAFEKEVLFPLAGLDGTRVEEYYKVVEVVGRLNYAGNEAARAYLDGTKTREEAIDWMVKYALSTPERAAQRLSFIDKYRAYVINYNLGQDLVADYVERLGGTDDHPARRWEIFKELLSSPRLPSGLSE